MNYTPLIQITIESIYASGSVKNVPLPTRMAKCTPDFAKAIASIDTDLQAVGGKLVLSDLYRSYDMQYQAWMDYVSGKKKAFSPKPPASMHEAGRAFDLDLSRLKIVLEDFWAIAKKHGVVPIIDTPSTSISEAWHFECRGSHQAVYDYYATGGAANFKPAKAMAISGILALGLPLDELYTGNASQFIAWIQAALIRLGAQPGAIDGLVGPRTLNALNMHTYPQVRFTLQDLFDARSQRARQEEIHMRLTAKLMERYPKEYF